MLEMRNISKIYRTDLIETHALRDFSLQVRSGEFGVTVASCRLP